MTVEEREARRIISLPVSGMLDDEELEIFNIEHLRMDALEQGERLFDVQAAAVRDYIAVGGGLFPIGVGWGKTGVALMCAQHDYEQGLERVMLMCRPSDVGSILRRHLPEWRARVPFDIPIRSLHGKGPKERRLIAESRAAGLYIMPFSLLSRPDGNELMELISPNALYIDEAHNLKRHDRGRGKKVCGREGYLQQRVDAGSPAKMLAMSGTMTKKSLSDYAHLARLALHAESPLPLSSNVLWTWDQLLRTDATRPDGFGIRSMAPLIAWARRTTGQEFNPLETESYRRAFRHRLVMSPGVVATGERELGVSLTLRNTPVAQQFCCGEGWDELQRLIAEVKAFRTPDGENIDHAMHCYKWLSELSAGFYYRLFWPSPAKLAKRRSIPEEEAKSLLVRAQMHHAAQQGYYREVHEFFKRAPLGLDTPGDVARAILRDDERVPSEVASAYKRMKGLEFEGMPQRDHEVIRVCDFKIQAAVRWAKEQPGGVVWFKHNAVGLWLREAFKEAGIDAAYCPAGADELIESIGDPLQGGKGDRVVIASIKAHGVAKNLQAFQHQLFVQWPREADDAEQALGRTHRNGQEADELVVDLLNTIEWDHTNLAACLNDAIYVQQTTDSRQKVIYCDWDPLPTVFSPELLRERGADPRSLNAAQREMLEEHFGYALSADDVY